MSTDSLEQIVARVEEAMVRGVNRPACLAEVPVSDLRHLIAELERAGRLAPSRPLR